MENKYIVIRKKENQFYAIYLPLNLIDSGETELEAVTKLNVTIDFYLSSEVEMYNKFPEQALFLDQQYYRIGFYIIFKNLLKSFKYI